MLGAFLGAVFTLAAYYVILMIALGQVYTTVYSKVPPTTLWRWGLYLGIGAVVGCVLATLVLALLAVPPIARRLPGLIVVPIVVYALAGLGFVVPAIANESLAILGLTAGAWGLAALAAWVRS